MSAIISPLTGNNDVILIEKINVADLIELYRKELAIEIKSELLGVQEINLYQCQQSGLLFFSPATPGGESFYSQLQKYPWYYIENKAEYLFARKFVQATDAVLDVGCGRGLFASVIAPAKFTGLEFSHAAIETAAKNNILVLPESVEQHALSHAEKYDVVCSFQVLEHVSNIHNFIQSCIDCLKPGGLAIFSTPSADSFARHSVNLTLNLPPHHMSLWPDNAYEYFPTLFPIELIQIWHETVQPAHQYLYWQTLFQNTLRNMTRQPKQLLDLSFKMKVLTKTSEFLSRQTVKYLGNTDLFPRGISVTSVFRKL